MDVSLKISPECMKFLKKVKELSGQSVEACMQCGVCSGSCPMVYADEMDITPRMMMRLVQLGQKEVLDSRTIWVCLTCLNCSVRCPRDIDIAKVSEALRQITLRRNLDYIRAREIPKEELERLPQIALVSNLRKFTA